MCHSTEVAAQKVAPIHLEILVRPQSSPKKIVEEVTPMKIARGKPKTFTFVIEKKR